MANSVDKQEIEVAVKETQVENVDNRDEVVSVELPAPDGWEKKFIPKKSGTPRRNEIVFISPTGEEIKNKKQLDMFLKAHPGGPPSSQFDWSTGDTPRRSARISEKSKATETPENEPVKKRERKSSSKKGAKEDSDDGDDEAPKEKQDAAAAQELKERKDVEMKEVEDGGDKNAEGVTVGEGIEVQQDSKNEMKDTIMETTKEANEDKNEENCLEKNTESIENPEEANKKNKTEPKEGQAENKSLPHEAVEEDKKSEVPPPLSGSNEVPPAEKEVKVAKESSEKEARVVDEASSEKVTESLLDNSSNHKESQEESKPPEIHSVNCEEAQHQPKASSQLLKPLN